VGNLDYKEFSRRRRPHYNPSEGTLFLTFRLAGSIPKSEVRHYRAKLHWLQDHLRRIQKQCDLETAPPLLIEQKERIEKHNRDWFIKTEAILHRADHGPVWLSEPAVAEKVAENLKRLDGEAYRLDAYSIMSNHVHSVFKPLLSTSELLRIFESELENFQLTKHPGLSKIMFSLKGRSARECNLILDRHGAFWEHESFDHVIRNGKFDKTVRYVLNNPVKVGLVSDWQEWPWNYCREELIERFRKK
jgi:REP element-mobilizing transposase RayT